MAAGLHGETARLDVGDRLFAQADHLGLACGDLVCQRQRGHAAGERDADAEHAAREIGQQACRDQTRSRNQPVKHRKQQPPRSPHRMRAVYAAQHDRLRQGGSGKASALPMRMCAQYGAAVNTHSQMHMLQMRKRSDRLSRTVAIRPSGAGPRPAPARWRWRG